MKKLMIYNDRWCSGGVEALWSNLISFFPEGEVETTLLVGQKETDLYDGVLEKKGVRMIAIGKTVIPDPVKRELYVIKRFKRIVREEKPDILHINICNAVGLLLAKKARRCGVKRVVVHSHNTQIERDRFGFKRAAHRILRFFYRNAPHERIACSSEAGKFLFGKKPFRILKNGVNVEKFRFDAGKRDKTRLALGAGNDLLFLHVGRFAAQKNHAYLVRLFAGIKKRCPNAKLVLVGEGSEREKIVQKVEEANLGDSVAFYGVTDRAEELFSAADCFLLPSLHEGLPVTAVEAQASGLPCFLADTISKEAKIIPVCFFFPLDADPDENAGSILTILHSASFERTDAGEALDAAGWNVRSEAEALYRMYEEVTA